VRDSHTIPPAQPSNAHQRKPARRRDFMQITNTDAGDGTSRMLDAAIFAQARRLAGHVTKGDGALP